MSARRDQILAHACDLYLEEGLDGFSMRKLAKALDVTAPALYRHYASKERVLIDVMGEAHRTLLTYLLKALRGQTPEDRFRLAGQGHVEFALDHRRYYEVLFMGVELLSLEEVRAEAIEQGRPVAQFWNDRVREMIDAGKLVPGDPHQIGLTFWAHSHGLISLMLKGMLCADDRATFVALYDQSSARLMQGLATKEYAQTLTDRLAAQTAPQLKVVGSKTEVG
jgi:AcrR family transcriptional regulator